MRVTSSIKRLKNRFPSCQIVRRRKHLFVICKDNPKGKVKQG